MKETLSPGDGMGPPLGEMPGSLTLDTFRLRPLEGTLLSVNGLIAHLLLILELDVVIIFL